MEFSNPHLPMSAAASLTRVAVSSVTPWRPVAQPHYVLMRRNQHFLAVKAPLDFFKPDELERMKIFGDFYTSGDRALGDRFRNAGTSVKAQLVGYTLKNSGQKTLGPATYELADTVLKATGPLWSPNGAIEPYFAWMFVEALLGSLPGEMLLKVRDRNVQAYEQALVRADWLVFLGVHLGWLDLKFLSELRQLIFSCEEGAALKGTLALGPEVSELYAAVKNTLPGQPQVPVEMSAYSSLENRIGQKLAARFLRVREQLILSHLKAESVTAKGGFLDVAAG